MIHVFGCRLIKETKLLMCKSHLVRSGEKNKFIARNLIYDFFLPIEKANNII